MHIKEYCNKQCILTSFGIVMAGVGTLIALCWAMIFQEILHEELKLTPKSKAYEPWKKPPLPLSLDIYFFNWTNPEDLTNHSTKPILQQLGPYRFTEIPDKVDIVWNDANSTVSYRKKSLFYFDEEGSNGSLDDEITSINVVALSAAARAKHWSFTWQKSVSMGLTVYNQEVSVTKLARELLFDGYEDDMVTLGKDMFAAGDVPFDKVGWFYMRNNTPDLVGHFNVHTGMDDIYQVGTMRNWNYAPRTEFFKDGCGMLNGSAGELYPPLQTKDKPINLFTPDMCRSLPFDFEEEVEIEGLTGYKYSGGEKTVDNGTVFPENLCFSPGESVPSGTLNISSCRFGTPVFMSFPHFYAADPFYLNQVDGLNPSKEKHQFYMTLEPTTGIALDVAARLQLNILIEPHPSLSLYKDVPKVFLPVLWFEQRVTMTADLASEIGAALSIPTTGRICGIVMLVIGLILIALVPLEKIIRKRYRIRDKDEKVKFQNSTCKAMIVPQTEKETEAKLVVEQIPLVEQNGGHYTA